MEKKRTIIQAVICVGLVCLIWGGYFFAIQSMEAKKHRQITLCDDDFSWVYQVDSVETEDKDFVICGFAFELDKDATEGSFEIVLHDIESGENYFSEMEYMERTDVNEYFLCKYDYLKSGFKATIKGKKLDLESKRYEVLLRVADEETAYQTGIYISEESLMYANPSEFIPLDVAGTDLEEIVSNGVLRVYEPRNHMYVYQHDGELYWIAEPEYFFEDNNVYIQYLMNTTQISKLPKNRLENNWYYDNLGFYFKQNKIEDWNTGEYRVAKKALPTEYSLTKIWTGYNEGEWLWKVDFRPRYEFSK